MNAPTLHQPPGERHFKLTELSRSWNIKYDTLRRRFIAWLRVSGEDVFKTGEDHVTRWPSESQAAKFSAWLRRNGGRR
jgi:hypothetical protein